MAIICLKIFCLGSFHSKPLHGLELISFSISGNKCGHGNTFFLFVRLINIFMASLHSIPIPFEFPPLQSLTAEGDTVQFY